MTMLPPAVVAKVPATTDKAGPSTSLSLASSETIEVKGVSSIEVTLSSLATGASLTGVTVMVSVPVSESAPSVTV